MNEDGESFGELVRASTRQEGYFASFVPVSAYENSQKNNELHYSRRKDVGNVQVKSSEPTITQFVEYRWVPKTAPALSGYDE